MNRINYLAFFGGFIATFLTSCDERPIVVPPAPAAEQPITGKYYKLGDWLVQREVAIHNKSEAVYISAIQSETLYLKHEYKRQRGYAEGSSWIHTAVLYSLQPGESITILPDCSGNPFTITYVQQSTENPALSQIEVKE